MVPEKELSYMITDWILAHGSTRDGPLVSEDENLIASGALDSMGFIELLEYVESVTGQKLYLEHVDSGVFTSVHGLVRHIVQTDMHAR